MEVVAAGPVESKATEIAPVASKRVMTEPVSSKSAVTATVASKPNGLEPVTPESYLAAPADSKGGVVAPVSPKPNGQAPVTSKPNGQKPVAPEWCVTAPAECESDVAAPVTAKPDLAVPVDDKLDVATSVSSKPQVPARIDIEPDVALPVATEPVVVFETIIVEETAAQITTEPIGVTKSRNLVSFEYEVQSSEVTKFGKYCKYAKPIFASIVAALGSVIVGTLNGYPSPAVPNINDNRNPFRIGIEEQSWFGSVVFLSGIVGAMFGSYMIDRFGRKFSFLIVSLPFVVGWTIIAGSYNITMMYIGRLICGLSFAIVLSTIGVYISEISPPEIRGVLISFHEIGVNVGVLGTYVVGSFLPWNWLAIVCASISCVQAILLLFVPETPRWLLMKGQREEAVESLVWLRGNGIHLELEMATIQQSLKETAEPVPWKEYFRPPLLRCLLITMSLYAVQQLSGVNLIRTYTVTIFEETGSHLDPYLLTVIIGAVLLGGSFAGTLVVDCFERRTLLIFSTLLMAVSMLAVGAFFEVKKLNPHFAKTYISWLPLVSMMTVSVGYVMGAASIPNVVTSELFSTRARGRASCFCIATLCFFGFLSTKLYSNMVSGIGMAGAFWFCAGISLVGSVIVYLFVPMTKGQSLEHIQSNLGQ